MLKLRLFGGLVLSREGETLTGAATQRQRLGLLALLAVARQDGVSRDKVLGYLWPDSEEKRARHVLNQLVYAQRRHFGADSLFLGKKSLRLNPALIWTDVGAFEEAVERGASAEAIELYRGPFLDGFFLANAPLFDEWMSAQRTRWANRAKALTVALARDRTGAGGDAIAWWRRAAELDPLDTDVVLGLIEALAQTGDRAGAIRAARAHEDRLKAELDVGPDPRLARLVQRLSSSPA
jgi:serine/threonine-protein kinase